MNDPLPSWTDGRTKARLIAFVREVTDPASAKFVTPEQRIATFDQDGTTWVEHPLYTEAVFALDRVKALAPEHPEWAGTEPWKAVLSSGRRALVRLTPQDLVKILAATHTGISTET